MFVDLGQFLENTEISSRAHQKPRLQLCLLLFCKVRERPVCAAACSVCDMQGPRLFEMTFKNSQTVWNWSRLNLSDQGARLTKLLTKLWFYTKAGYQLDMHLRHPLRRKLGVLMQRNILESVSVTNGPNSFWNYLELID